MQAEALRLWQPVLVTLSEPSQQRPTTRGERLPSGEGRRTVLPVRSRPYTFCARATTPCHKVVKKCSGPQSTQVDQGS